MVRINAEPDLSRATVCRCCARTEGGLWQIPKAWEFFTSARQCFGANHDCRRIAGRPHNLLARRSEGNFGSGWDAGDCQLRKKHFETIECPPNAGPARSIRIEDNAGALWIGTYGGG